MTIQPPSLDVVSQVLTKMIADKMDIDVVNIQPDSNLQALGLDSLDTFDLIFNAEDHFKIKVPNDQINISTLQDVATLVHRLVVEQA
ncbi:MAG: phosphopantetheine-binding protein [Betaproteobacteria bacterium]